MLPDAEDAIRVAGCNGDIFVRVLEDRRISHSIKVMDGYPVAGTCRTIPNNRHACMHDGCATRRTRRVGSPARSDPSTDSVARG